jgi:hypothetical protein
VLTLNHIAMKKKLLLSTFLLFTTIVFSQNVENAPISWGIRAGFDRAHRTNLQYHEDEGSAFSEFLGIYVQKRLHNASPYYFQGELLYKTFTVNNWFTVKTINIEMPFSLKLVQRRKGNFNIYAGLGPVIPLASLEYSDYQRFEYKTPINLSYFAGIGGQLPFWQNKIGLELRYCRYLADNYAYETASPGSTRNFTLTNNASTFDWALTYKFK